MNEVLDQKDFDSLEKIAKAHAIDVYLFNLLVVAVNCENLTMNELYVLIGKDQLPCDFTDKYHTHGIRKSPMDRFFAVALLHEVDANAFTDLWLSYSEIPVLLVIFFLRLLEEKILRRSI